jgi:hypothetical protein
MSNEPRLSLRSFARARSSWVGALAPLLVVSLSACSSKDDTGGSGGMSNLGGSATGGSGVGGAGTTGGIVSTGGVASTGGASTTGGSGGIPTSGGASNGGASNGGVSSKGGASSTGGSTPAAGSSNGGVAGMNGGAMNSAGTQAMAGAGAAGASGGAATVGGVAAVISGGVRWIGRVDTANAAGPRFAWSATGFIATVSGTAISVKLRSDGGNDPIFFQPVIDGMTKPRFSVASSEAAKTVSLATGLADIDHVVELYRDSEGRNDLAYSTFLGFAAGTPKAPPEYLGRLIEIVGDSISAGYGDLGSEQHPNGGADPSGGCHFTTQTESAYVTYGAVAARALKADASIVAASGWGIYSDNNGDTNAVMPKVYANMVGGLATPAWSFEAKPQAVIVNLGTNDFSANANLGKDTFSAPYKAFLATLRAKYPNAWIYCALGPLLYGSGLTNATSYINAIVADTNAAGDKKVKLLDFGSQDTSKGTGCDYHPNAVEQQRMADILTKELKTTLGW